MVKHHKPEVRVEGVVIPFTPQLNSKSDKDVPIPFEGQTVSDDWLKGFEVGVSMGYAMRVHMIDRGE